MSCGLEVKDKALQGLGGDIDLRGGSLKLHSKVERDLEVVDNGDGKISVNASSVTERKAIIQNGEESKKFESEEYVEMSAVASKDFGNADFNQLKDICERSITDTSITQPIDLWALDGEAFITRNTTIGEDGRQIVNVTAIWRKPDGTEAMVTMTQEQVAHYTYMSDDLCCSGMTKSDAEDIALKTVVGKELFGEAAAESELTASLSKLTEKYSTEQCQQFFAIIDKYSDEQFVKRALATATKALNEKIKAEAASKEAALLAQGGWKETQGKVRDSSSFEAAKNSQQKMMQWNLAKNAEEERAIREEAQAALAKAVEELSRSRLREKKERLAKNEARYGTSA